MNQNNEEKAVIFGRNPVLEALKNGRRIDKLFILQGTDTG